MSAPAKAQPPRHHVRNEWAAERHVYEPHLVGLPPIGQYVREVWRRREFAVEMARTRLRGQHYQTAFGQLWLVLNPLLLAIVYFVLIDIVRRGNHPPGFFAHLVAGIFAYHFISDAVRDGVKSVTRGGKLILNSAFPRMLLPLSSVVIAFLRFLPTVVIYVPVHLIFGRPVGFALLWAVPLVGLMVVMAAGFAMIVAAVQVYFRDLANFVPYVLRVAMFLAPVLYFARDVPGGYKVLLDINPLGQLLTAWSDVLYAGQAPGWHSLLIAAVWSFGAFFAGALFFMSRERDFAVRL